MELQVIQANKVLKGKIEVKFPFSRSVPFTKEKVYTKRFTAIFGSAFITIFFRFTKVSFLYSKITMLAWFDLSFTITNATPNMVTNVMTAMAASREVSTPVSKTEKKWIGKTYCKDSEEGGVGGGGGGATKQCFVREESAPELQKWNSSHVVQFT